MKKRENKKHRYYGQTLVQSTDKKTFRRKRIIAAVSLVVALALFVALSVYLTREIFRLEEGENVLDLAKKFRDMVKGYGIWGVFVAFGIQVLQVVISPIPGEVVEVGMGLAYGWFWGAVLCLLGSALGTVIIILFVRHFGTKFVELFISVEKINDLRFLNTEKKLERTVFILYLVPGTPKDPLIFFFGLTNIGLADFVIISTLARIPSVITSTIGAELISSGSYVGAIIMFAVVGAISLVFVILYKKILAKLKERSRKKHETETDEEQ